MTSHVDNGDNRCTHRLRRSLWGMGEPTLKGSFPPFTASPYAYICSGAICGALVAYLHCHDGQHLTEGDCSLVTCGAERRWYLDLTCHCRLHWRCGLCHPLSARISEIGDFPQGTIRPTFNRTLVLGEGNHNDACGRLLARNVMPG